MLLPNELWGQPRQALRTLLRSLGRKGGKKRFSMMTPEERSAFGREAVQARWGKAKAGKSGQARVKAKG